MKRLLIAALLVCAVLPVSLHAQGKFSGYMFGDYFYNVARDSSFRNGNLSNSAVNGKKDLNAFQFRRIYFTYDNDISENFTSRFRLEADQSALSSNGKISTFVKDAYLRWKNIFKGSELVFGIQPTPAYEISEAAWGYRSLEKTQMDLRGIIPSRHLGVSLKGKIDDGGSVNYWVLVANNSTSTSIPNGTDPYFDKYKRVSGLIHVKPTQDFQVTLYGDYLARPSINDPASTTNPRATVSNSAITGALFLGYAQKDKFSVGAEAFILSASNGMPDTAGGKIGLKSMNAMGISVFGNVILSPELSLVARYDYFDPNTDSNVKGDMRNYIIVGLSYKADKNVMIIPNVQYETYEKIPNGPSFDASVNARITFYYIFL